MATKEPQFFTIPAGERLALCRYCEQPVYWIETPAGKKMPVSIEYPGAFAPSARDDGSGISHFIDCPERDRARRR